MIAYQNIYKTIFKAYKPWGYGEYGRLLLWIEMLDLYKSSSVHVKFSQCYSGYPKKLTQSDDNLPLIIQYQVNCSGEIEFMWIEIWKPLFSHFHQLIFR